VTGTAAFPLRSLAPTLTGPPALAGVVVASLVVWSTGCGSDTKITRHEDPPQAFIDGPVDSDVFRLQGPDIPLVGRVDDSWDEVPTLAATWILPDGSRIDVDADPIGNVALSIPVDDWETGLHVFELEVVDSDGMTGLAQGSFQVFGPLGPPTAQITVPATESTFPEDTSVTFQGQGSDLTTPADDLAFEWSSDLDGVLGGAISADGSTVVVVPSMTPGVHTITLTATDEDLEQGTDSVIVTIGDDGSGSTDIPQDAEPGDVVFSEMMVNPEVVADEVGEWIELYNTSDYPVDLAGYSFHDDDVDMWILGTIIVPPKEYVVLCAELDPASNGGVPCDAWFYRNWEGNGIALANREDELVLTRADGAEIDWLHYDANWFSIAVATGVDPEFLEGGANNDGANWCDQTTIMAPMVEPGTPGYENDPCD
jgi:hypothetical protein